MARYKNGINGPLSGKVGSVVAANWRGIDTMRGLPEVITKCATEAQLLQRSILALANSWLKPIRDLIWIGFQNFKGTKTPMNGAVSLLMKEAVIVENNVPVIDFAKVLLSRGELLISWVLEVLALVDAVLLISWDNAPPSAFNRETDRATFVVYNPVKGQFATFLQAAVREDKQALLHLPANFSGDTVHSYMLYVNVAGDAVSTGQYLGAAMVR